MTLHIYEIRHLICNSPIQVLSTRYFVIFVIIINSSRNIKSKNEPLFESRWDISMLLFVKIYSFYRLASISDVLSVRFRSSQTSRRGNVHDQRDAPKKSIDPMNSCDLANFFFIYLFFFSSQFYAIYIRERVEVKKVSEHFRVLPREFRLEHA